MMVCPRCWGKREGDCDKCDNTGRLESVKLTKNFTLDELVWSNTAKSKTIANDPTVRHVDRLLELSRELLQPLRDDVGPLVVTSGFRSLALNKAIGGSKNSAHMVGYAADVIPVKVPLERLMTWFRDTHRSFDQAIIEKAGAKEWVHIGLKHPTTGEQRRQLLRYNNGKYTIWKK